MSEWLKNLAPEFYILFLGGLLLIIIVILILIYVVRIVREIAGKALKLTEEIVNADNEVYTLIKIVNKSYIDNQIRGIGVFYKKQKHVINDDEVTIEARDKHEVLISHREIRDLIGIDEFKISKVRFYYENSLGNITRKKAKLTRREIKQALKIEKKAFIQALKEERYKTGQFNSRDRMRIFFQKMANPFKRMSQNSKVKRNKKIADQRMQREVEKEREALILEQKLIYEQQVREQAREDLTKEYKIEELKENLEKMKKENGDPDSYVSVEEIIGTEEVEKPKKKSKKKKELEEKEPEVVEDNEVVDETEVSK